MFSLRHVLSRSLRLATVDRGYTISMRANRRPHPAWRSLAKVLPAIFTINMINEMLRRRRQAQASCYVTDVVHGKYYAQN